MPDTDADGDAVKQKDAAPKSRRRRKRQPERVVYVPRVNHINTCLKYALFLFNFVFWLGGLTCVGIGIYLFVSDSFSRVIQIIAWMVLLAGIVTTLVSFFGCIGALRDNIWLLRIYLGCLIFMIIALVAVGIFILLVYYVPDVRTTLRLVIEDNTMQSAVRDYMDDDGLRSFIDEIQVGLECCGIRDKEGYKDWGKYNVYYNCTYENRSPKRCGVPESCCRRKKDEIDNIACGNDIQNREPEEAKLFIFVKGCGEAFIDSLRNNTTLIGIIILVLIAIQVFACIFAYFYINQIKRQIAQWNYH